MRKTLTVCTVPISTLIEPFKPGEHELFRVPNRDAWVVADRILHALCFEAYQQRQRRGNKVLRAARILLKLRRKKPRKTDVAEQGKQVSEELKPCPFCGAPGRLMSRDPDLRAIEELRNWLSKEIHEQIEHNNYGNQDCLWNFERELKRIVEKYRTEKDS